MKYIRKRVSSKSDWAKENLNDSNHISEFMDRVYEIYGVENSEIKNPVGKGYEHTITAWSDDKMDVDEDNNPLDIQYYTDEEGSIIWEPYIEFLIKDKAFKKQRVGNIRFGYIDGRNSHMGPMNSGGMMSSANRLGYQMWVEFEKEK